MIGRLKELYWAGESVEDMARDLGKSVHWVKRQLYQHRVVGRTNGPPTGPNPDKTYRLKRDPLLERLRAL